MAPTLTSYATGASPLEAKEQRQNSHWYQLNVCGIYPPQKYRKFIHVLQRRFSRRAPCLLLYGVEIGGPLFFSITLRVCVREREREVELEI